MQAVANNNGYNAMMSAGHHFWCASYSISVLSADVIRVMSAFSVILKGIIIKGKKKRRYIQEYAYAST